MITLFLIVSLLLLALICIVTGFGWLLFILADVAIAVWIIVQIVKALRKETKGCKCF